MVQLPEFGDIDWYLDEVKKLFVHGNTAPRNINNAYERNVESLNHKLEAIISVKDFSNYHGRTFLEELVIAPFSDLKKIYEKVNKQWKEIFYKEPEEGKENSSPKMKEEWEKLYSAYDKFIDKKLNIKLIEIYGIKCCPYCNENFIFNRNTYAMAQLDHFYPRNKYPIFSMCLYNLVPVCSVCNHIKSDKIIGVSPHDHSYDYSSLRISYVPKSSNWIDNHKEIKIKFLCKEQDEEFAKKIKMNLERMQIEKSYDTHTDYVQEILKKAQIYNEEARNNLRGDFPDLFNSDEELLRVIFGNYIGEKEILNRPLSKLTRDILKELHIID